LQLNSYYYYFRGLHAAGYFQGTALPGGFKKIFGSDPPRGRPIGGGGVAPEIKSH